MQQFDIQDDDYVIQDSGRLGSEYFVSIVDDTFDSFDECIKAIAENMRQDCFYPSVYYVNDHGNTDLLSVNSDTGEYSIIESHV